MFTKKNSALIVVVLLIFAVLLFATRFTSIFLKKTNMKVLPTSIPPSPIPINFPPQSEITQGYRENYDVNLYENKIILPTGALHKDDVINIVNNDTKPHSIVYQGKAYQLDVHEMLGTRIEGYPLSFTIQDKTLNLSETIPILYEE